MRILAVALQVVGLVSICAAAFVAGGPEVGIAVAGLVSLAVGVVLEREV